MGVEGVWGFRVFAFPSPTVGGAACIPRLGRPPFPPPPPATVRPPLATRAATLPAVRTGAATRRLSQRPSHNDISTANAKRTMAPNQDRKSTRLNSSHLVISYAVFCLKTKQR